MAAGEWRYRGEADEERGYTVDDNRRSAWAQWGTGRNHGDDGLRPPPQKGRSGDLPKPVHFVSAVVPSSSDEHGNSRNLASSSSSSVDPPRQATTSPAPEPGSLASNAVVAQMMKRMNYKQGSGLGRHGQGITAPIEVALRPKNAGLGSDKGPIVIGGGADALPPPSDENWPKWDEAGRGARKRKRDREFDDKILLARRLEEGAAEAVARVQKTLARAARWSSTSSGLLPVDDETPAAAAAITEAMKRVQEQRASGTLTTAELVREFAALKARCPREYAAHHLADAARATATPLLLRAAAFRRWEPLEEDPDDPSRSRGLVETVTALRHVLSDDASSPYAALVDDVVVRPALASAAEAWDARYPEPMVRFLETWGVALPLAAVQRVLERGVVPKLSAAVARWEPRWEPEPPCHTWVQRWVPLLGHRWLEPLLATVRRKLGEALLGWHAARAVADHGMVAPWKDAFGHEAWVQFVARHVVPYLRRGLRALRVAPPEPDDGGFAGVMRWASTPSVASARDMARLLEEEFFGKWQDALRRWLWAARPAAGEAMAWHQGWKRLLTPELLAEERVSVPIEACLQMIDRAAQGLEIYRREHRQHAGEAHSCRSRSRWRAGVGTTRSNKRHY